MVTKILVVLAAVLVSTSAVDWRTITCDQLYKFGIGSFTKLCDLETSLDAVCAKRNDDTVGKTFATECHMKIINCQADFHRKTISGKTPLYAQKYSKVTSSQTSKYCPDFNQKYCETKTKTSCKSKSTYRVCGSDGVTYDNDCALEAAKCVAQREGKRQPYKTRSSACPSVVG